MLFFLLAMFIFFFLSLHLTNSFFKSCLFILFLVALSLCCYAWGLSNCSEQGLLFVLVCGLLMWWLLLLQSTGSRHMVFSSCSTWAPVIVVHWLSCSTACGIFLDQGLNLCFLPGRQIPVCCTTREVHLNNLWVSAKIFPMKTLLPYSLPQHAVWFSLFDSGVSLSTPRKMPYLLCRPLCACPALALNRVLSGHWSHMCGAGGGNCVLLSDYDRE